MTETINTGQVSTSGTRTYISGTASGIDTNALVEAAYAQKLAPADKIDTKIDTNEGKITAYKELQTLTNSLSTSLSGLKSYTGYTTTDNSIYDQKAAYASVSDGTTLSSLASISVSNSAEKGAYSVEIIQLATAMKAASATQSSNTSALGYNGSFALGIDGGTSTSISITDTMSLNDIAKAINDSNSGVKATVVRANDSSYTLSLSATSTGSEIIYNSTAGSDVFSMLGLTDGNGDFTNITQQAQDAIVIFDGVQITSNTNTLSNVVEGVTLSLVGAKPGSTINLEIDYNYESVKTAITDFVDAYNALRDFVIANQQVGTDGSASEDAILFSDTLMQSLNDEMASLISGMQSSSGLATLRDMGITLDSTNKLVISDEDALNNALLNNYKDVQSFFQSSFSADNSQLSLLRNTSPGNSLEFTLDIEMDGLGNIVSASIGGDSSMFEVSGTRITGKTGTAYEGLVFVYTGTTNASINVDLDQGLADRLSNIANKYGSTTGQLQQEVDSLQNINSTLSTEAERIRERASSYRDRLIERYAQMESDIEAADLLLRQIRAILGTSDDD